MSAPVDVLAMLDRLDSGLPSVVVGDTGCVTRSDRRELRAAVAELIDRAKRVQMIPSPVGTGYQDGTPEDAAYIKGFMYALRLVREPGFACGLDAALARVQGGAA